MVNLDGNVYEEDYPQDSDSELSDPHDFEEEKVP